MKCPACGNTLSVMTVGSLEVDVCRGGCGGIWFDQLELTKVDDQEEAAGGALLEIERDPSVQVDAKARRRCPKCPEIVMLRHFYGPKQRIEIDECGKCGGIWLDAGELAAIRGEYTTHEERHQAAHDFSREVLGKKLGSAPPALGGLGKAGGHALPIGSLLRFMWPK